MLSDIDKFSKYTFTFKLFEITHYMLQIDNLRIYNVGTVCFTHQQITIIVCFIIQSDIVIS